MTHIVDCFFVESSIDFIFHTQQLTRNMNINDTMLYMIIVVKHYQTELKDVLIFVTSRSKNIIRKVVISCCILLETSTRYLPPMYTLRILIIVVNIVKTCSIVHM